MLKAAYSIVRETTKNISAMEIKNIDDSDVRYQSHNMKFWSLFTNLVGPSFRSSFQVFKMSTFIGIEWKSSIKG